MTQQRSHFVQLLGRTRKRLLFSLCAGLTASAVAGEKSFAIPFENDPGYGGYFTFYLDNDLFTGTDRNYTNGLRLSYITEGRPQLNIPWIQRNIHLLSGNPASDGWLQNLFGLKNKDAIEYSYGFALTQLMYTPETLETQSPPTGEHPYAGWLGIGFSLHARDDSAVNSIEVSLGVVGPNSYAEEAQDFIHELRDLEQFQGWDSQVPEEFTLNFALTHRRRLACLDDVDLPLGLALDGLYEAGCDLGNHLTAVHIGAMVRIGWNLPAEVTDPRISTSAHTQKLHSDVNGAAKWSLYALAGVRGSGVAHDIVLDGPVFRNFDTGVNREPWVGEIYAGVGVRYKTWEVGYVHSIRSERYTAQSGSQSFGSLTIRKRF